MSISIWWIHKDCRLHDNAALTSACKEGKVLPVFVIDKAFEETGAAFRWRFQRSLRAIDKGWHDLTGERVLCLKGEPEDVLVSLAKDLNARIFTEERVFEQEREVLRVVAKNLGEGQLRVRVGNTLLPLGALRNGSGEKFKVFTPFYNATERAETPPVFSLPTEVVAFKSDVKGHDCLGLDMAQDMHSGADVLESWSKGAGEVAAKSRFHSFMERITNYAQNRDNADVHACSGLSESLACGEIGMRDIWDKTLDYSWQEATTGRLKFRSELVWRDFAKNMSFDTAQNQDLWDNFGWRNDISDFNAWQKGETGISIVDAGMREMRITGTMHNRVRMICASYLVKNLLIDWRWGRDFFADSLTDWDPSSNEMNWRWVSGIGYASAPFFRVFNPHTQAAKFDSSKTYRKTWLYGYEGETLESAKDFFKTIPSSWSVARPYQEMTGIKESLASQRTRALQEYDIKRQNDASLKNNA